MKTSFLAFLLVLSIPGASAVAAVMDGQGILKDSAGKLLTFSQDDALTACPGGTHLPSVREAAQFYEDNGGKTLTVEQFQTEFANKDPDAYISENLSRYDIAYATNPDGTKDSFAYQNGAGSYVPPSRDVSVSRFWTSTYDGRNYNILLKYNGRNPGITSFIGMKGIAVRCVR